MQLLVQLAIAAVINLVAAILSIAMTPKPKTRSAKMETPESESGIPVPVIFGEIEIKAPNVVFVGNRAQQNYKI